MILFNPPFSLNVRKNARKTFLKILKSHFPKDNPNYIKI